jgi:Ca2+-binding RTX toxin-like protein
VSRRLVRLVPLAALPLAVGVALTATNTVVPSFAGRSTRPATANDLKPAACAALNLGTVVTGAGSFSAGGGASLVLGSPGNDRIRGGGGDDCILGGGGDDDIRGGGGSDVCIGGPGNDTFRNCAVTIP